jgi:chromosome partitioning protein
VTKRLLIASPKGGAGKTTAARNIAVAAALDGVVIATADLDPQRTFTNWYSRRTESSTTWHHYPVDMTEATELVEDADFDSAELLIIDTPPSIEANPAGMKRLIIAADLALVLCRPTRDDADSAIPFMRLLRDYERPAAFVLNAVKPRVNMLAVKGILDAVGPVCPFELSDRYDYARAGERGMGLAEIPRHDGVAEVNALWGWISRELWGRQ